MAFRTAVGVGTVAVTGAVAIDNKESIEAGVRETIRHSLHKATQPGSIGVGDGNVESQVTQLSKELQLLHRSLAEQNSQSRVIYVGGQSTTTWLGTGVVVAAGAGAYMWYKGYTWENVMYASKAALSAAADGLSESISIVQDTIEQTREQLYLRLEEAQRLLSGEISETRLALESGLTETREGVELVQGQVGLLQDSVDDMANNMGSQQARLEYATRGIQLLCKSVADAMPEGSSAELKAFASDANALPPIVERRRPRSAPNAMLIQGDGSEGQDQIEGGGPLVEQVTPAIGASALVTPSKESQNASWRGSWNGNSSTIGTIGTVLRVASGLVSPVGGAATQQ